LGGWGRASMAESRCCTSQLYGRPSRKTDWPGNLPATRWREPLTWHFSLSGWRDSNPRPLLPNRYFEFISAHQRLTKLVALTHIRR
jgi:hypothetical protein